VKLPTQSIHSDVILVSSRVPGTYSQLLPHVWSLEGLNQISKNLGSLKHLGVSFAFN
jgi:hypothetical protein